MNKRFLSVFLSLILIITSTINAFAGEDVTTESKGLLLDSKQTVANVDMQLSARSAILMEKATGEVLWEINADEQLSPASVTKVMDLLLIFEAIRDGKLKYDDMITVSEHAAGMGGSQAYMEAGEQFPLDDMLKAMFVSSCNDAAVAMAEKISGSEELFVARMNERAAELGMVNTHFSDCTGLTDENHYTSARDIAIMSRALLAYPEIRKYTLIWMDTIRGGQFGLSSTNKMLKSYNGITGLKTGFTSKAKYCISSTAERDGMELIAVIMASPTSKQRNADAAKLLDYGFANYGLVSYTLPPISTMKVERGKINNVEIGALKSNISKLTAKGGTAEITSTVTVPKFVAAPIEKNQVIGKVTYMLGDQVIEESDIVAMTAVPAKNFFDYFLQTMGDYFMI